MEGMKEVQTALRRLPNVTARRITYRIMRRRLKPIADDMRTLAPDGEGDLKKSITVGTKLSKRQRSMHRRENRHDMEMFAGPGPLPQAVQQEFGNENHPPQPFARPAWDRGKNGLVKGLANDFWIEIKKEIAKRGK